MRDSILDSQVEPVLRNFGVHACNNLHDTLRDHTLSAYVVLKLGTAFLGRFFSWGVVVFKYSGVWFGGFGIWVRLAVGTIRRLIYNLIYIYIYMIL